MNKSKKAPDFADLARMGKLPPLEELLRQSVPVTEGAKRIDAERKSST